MHTLVELEDRRELSLLVAFADIHGYFRHALRRADDRALAEDLDEHYRLITARIASAGGLVVKFVGDATLAVFEEAGVDRGVECLLALKEETDGWLAERGWRGCTLNVKAHFGTVIAGPYGPPGAQRFDVIGKAVNAAARLASPGLAISPQAFRKLGKEVRQRFKKHTPPVTYIRLEDRRAAR